MRPRSSRLAAVAPAGLGRYEDGALVAPTSVTPALSTASNMSRGPPVRWPCLVHVRPAVHAVASARQRSHVTDARRVFPAYVAGQPCGAVAPVLRCWLAAMIAVENRPELGRYQLWLDGELAAYAAYEVHGVHMAFMHTQIEEQFAGRGLGTRLVGDALDDVRANGGSVLPYCPFVRSFIAKHSDYLDLVPAGQRAAFGLASDDPSPGDGETL